MRKYLATIAIASLMFVGCGGPSHKMEKMEHKNHHSGNHKMMFQSVPKDKAKIIQDAKYGETCPLCNMNLPKYYKTNHVAHTKDGTKQYCSIHCVVEDHEHNKSDLKDIKVVAVDTLEFIDAKKAHYVVGSSKKGTMSGVSKYAFDDEKKAREFIKEYGGTLANFYEAYNEAKKDFK